jgi:NADH-quinone oxidoreductase subunit H
MHHWLDPVIVVARSALLIGIILGLVPFLVWLERKGSAYIQDRPGPERASVFGLRLAGLLHLVADAVKMLNKEDIIPSGANRFYYLAAPIIVVAVAFTTVAILPLFDTIDFNRVGVNGWPVIAGQSLDVDPGILWFFAIASLTVYGIIFAGWASNSKYSLLGAMRASAAVLSYEIPLGLSVIGALMVYGTVSLPEIVRWQGEHVWGILIQPLGALIFVVCAFAETNRVPFDLAESESELVAGYHTEYSAMKFGMFFLAEYGAMIVSSGLIITLFFGGWQVPFLSTQALVTHAQVITQWSLGVAFAGSLVTVAVLLVHFTQRFGIWRDLRDYEPLVLAALVLGGGLTALGGLFVLMAVPLPVWYGPIFAAVAQFGMFMLKLLLVCWVFVWVRWTLPRFRYDQVMNLGWRSLLPLALVNILLTGIVITVFNV